MVGYHGNTEQSRVMRGGASSIHWDDCPPAEWTGMPRPLILCSGGPEFWLKPKARENCGPAEGALPSHLGNGPVKRVRLRLAADAHHCACGGSRSGLALGVQQQHA